jgi:hypothetical protein
LNTIVNIYLPGSPAAVGDGATRSPPHDDAGAPTTCTQPVIINTGDFAQINVIPSYAGNGQRGAAGGRDVARPASKRLAGDGNSLGSDAMIAAQAGKWVHALRTLMNRAAGPDLAQSSADGHPVDAFKASASAAIGAGVDAVSRADQLADRANASRSDEPVAAAMSNPVYVLPQLWSPRQTYNPGDRVVYGNHVYQVPSGGGNHAGIVPGTHDAKWLYAGTVENNSKYFFSQHAKQHSQA